MTLAVALRAHAATRGDAEAVVSRRGRYSYAELNRQVDSLASGLVELGVGSGDRLATWLSNREELLFVYLACARIGAVFVPINTRHTSAEVIYVLQDCGAAVLVLEEEFDGASRREAIPRLSSNLREPARIISIEGTHPRALAFADVLRKRAGPGLSAREAAVGRHEVALIIYTSGTTGRPKGAMLTHVALRAYAESAARVGFFGASDRVLLQVPFATTAGAVIQAAPVIRAGGALVLLDVFKAEASLELIKAERITCYVAPPTMLVLQLDALNETKHDVSSLRHLITGAAPVPPELVERVLETMSPKLTNSYGATESGGLVTYMPETATREQVVATCGVAMPGCEVRIVDANRLDVPALEVGEIAVRAGSIMSGYHQADAQTSDVLDSEGWWYSGDLGTLDAAGYLRVVGRQKDMYIRGGFNVYPTEIEAVLGRHQDVAMCAIVGFADPVLGEKGRAFVVARRPRALSAESVREFCARELADYKVPDDVVFVHELPVTGPGKVDRAALAALESAGGIA